MPDLPLTLEAGWRDYVGSFLVLAIGLANLHLRWRRSEPWMKGHRAFALIISVVGGCLFVFALGHQLVVDEKGIERRTFGVRTDFVQWDAVRSVRLVHLRRLKWRHASRVDVEFFVPDRTAVTVPDEILRQYGAAGLHPPEHRKFAFPLSDVAAAERGPLMEQILARLPRAELNPNGRSFFIRTVTHDASDAWFPYVISSRKP